MGKGHAHKPGGTNVREISNPSGGGGNVRNDGEAKQTRDNTGGIRNRRKHAQGKSCLGGRGFFFFVKETFCEFKKKKKTKEKKRGFSAGFDWQHSISKTRTNDNEMR